VFPICCGVAELGTRVDRDASFRLLDAYVAAGGNFFDSAHCYGFWAPDGLGASERTLGAFLRERGIRDRAVIATKGGHPDAGPGYCRPERFLAPEVIASDVQESLERLATNHIDLYYLHRDDGTTPVDEVLDALDGQVSGGRVRYLGASNWSVERVREANLWARKNGRPGFVALQNQWSLAVPTWQPTADPTVRYITPADARQLQEEELTLVPYSATANGYFATCGERGAAFRSPENEARLHRAQTLASRLAVTPNQIALAWLRAQPLTVVPAVGTVDVGHLQDALGSLKLDLSPAEAKWLSDGVSL
jgi:aryl-alcohol dehydrogenase-like predicted oxidoreductase